MNQVDEKPMKPKWFVIVELVLSFALLYALLAIFVGLANGLALIGVPPMWAMIGAALILVAVVHLLILPNWKTRK